MGKGKKKQYMLLSLSYPYQIQLLRANPNTGLNHGFLSRPTFFCQTAKKTLTPIFDISAAIFGN
jgi:hypothetical protein